MRRAFIFTANAVVAIGAIGWVLAIGLYALLMAGAIVSLLL